MNLIDKRIELFNMIIKELFTCELNYLDKLLKLKDTLTTSFTSIKSKDDFFPITKQMDIFRNYIHNKAEFQLNEIKSLERDIINPLNKFTDSIKTNAIKNNIKEIEKKRLILNEQIIKLREKYFEALKEAETSLFNYQMSLRTKVHEEKFKSKANKKIEQGKQLEKDYEKAIKSGNELTTEYLNLFKDYEKIWNDYYSLENNLLFKINLIFSIKVNDEIVKLKNDVFQFGKMKIEGEPEIFPNLYQKEQERRMFKFVPYIPSALDSLKDSVNINVLMELEKNFNLCLKEKINCEETNKELKFKTLTGHFAGHAKSFSKSEIVELKTFLKEKKYREQFLLKINQFRSKSSTFNNEHAFKILYDCFNYTLEQIQFDAVDEYETVKTCLLLSQTLYREKEGKKIYVETHMKNNLLLTNENFWRNFIESEIDKQKLQEGDSIKNHILLVLPSFKNVYEYIRESDKIDSIFNYFQEKYGFEQKELESIKNEITKEKMIQLELEEKDKKEKMNVMEKAEDYCSKAVEGSFAIKDNYMNSDS